MSTGKLFLVDCACKKWRVASPHEPLLLCLMRLHRRRCSELITQSGPDGSVKTFGMQIPESVESTGFRSDHTDKGQGPKKPASRATLAAFFLGARRQGNGG